MVFIIFLKKFYCLWLLVFLKLSNNMIMGFWDLIVYFMVLRVKKMLLVMFSFMKKLIRLGLMSLWSMDWIYFVNVFVSNL